MKKLLILAGLLLLFSCEKDSCECLKKSYDYSGDYPVMSVEEIDCPDDMEDGEDRITWDEANGRIDYILSKTCKY